MASSFFSAKHESQSPKQTQPHNTSIRLFLDEASPSSSHSALSHSPFVEYCTGASKIHNSHSLSPVSIFHSPVSTRGSKLYCLLLWTHHCLGWICTRFVAGRIQCRVVIASVVDEWFGVCGFNFFHFHVRFGGGRWKVICPFGCCGRRLRLRRRLSKQ